MIDEKILISISQAVSQYSATRSVFIQKIVDAVAPGEFAVILKFSVAEFGFPSKCLCCDRLQILNITTISHGNKELRIKQL
jgi:hypothetical protein